MLVLKEVSVMKDDDLDLTVELSGLKITVRKGTFRRQGKDYTLPDDIEHDAVLDPSVPTTITGYLVLDNGVPELLVDEVKKDGEDESVRWKDVPYKFLRILFNARNIPGGTTDLNDRSIQFQVHRVKRVAEG